MGLAPGDFVQIRPAYKALALALHPDKCQADLRELHTTLFQKVQDAYETLSKIEPSTWSPPSAPKGKWKTAAG